MAVRSLDRRAVVDEAAIAEAMAMSEAVRIAEALLFAASEPVTEATLAAALPEGTEVGPVLRRVAEFYAGRGVNLVEAGGGWCLRTAPDLAHLLRGQAPEPRRLSRAATETLAIIAYHQPVTRAEIEDIRGVAVAKGTLDVLLEAGWIRMRGRRRTPGRPVTFGTTDAFLSHFGLASVSDLPGLEELSAVGLAEGVLPRGQASPWPVDDQGLGADEDPLEPDVLDAARQERIDAGEPPLEPGHEPGRTSDV